MSNYFVKTIFIAKIGGIGIHMHCLKELKAIIKWMLTFVNIDISYVGIIIMIYVSGIKRAN